MSDTDPSELPPERHVVLVEDDEECAAGCQLTLARHGWTSSWYATGHAALAAARRGAAMRLVLMDLELPGESACVVLAALHEAVTGLQVIAFTSHAGDDYLFGALRAGAVGYLLKHDAIGRLPELLEEVNRGGSPMSPGIARRVLGHFGRAPGETPAAPLPTVAPSSRLSEREREVVQLLAHGCSYADCARVLGISLDTVRTHVRHGYEKLHVCSKAEAVAAAFRQGWVR